MAVSVTDIMHSMNKLGAKDEEFRNWVSDIVYQIIVVCGVDIDSYTVSPDGNKVWLAFEDQTMNIMLLKFVCRIQRWAVIT